MKVTRKLLIRQLDALYQIKNICRQTDVEDCCKCPYDGILCDSDRISPNNWDLDDFVKRIIEWEGYKHV